MLKINKYKGFKVLFVPVEEKKNLFFFTIQERVEKAEKAKADLLLCKLSADEECIKAEEELMKLKDFQEKQRKDIVMSRDTHEVWRRLSYSC